MVIFLLYSSYRQNTPYILADVVRTERCYTKKRRTEMMTEEKLSKQILLVL